MLGFNTLIVDTSGADFVAEVEGSNEEVHLLMRSSLNSVVNCFAISPSPYSSVSHIPEVYTTQKVENDPGPLPASGSADTLKPAGITNRSDFRTRDRVSRRRDLPIFSILSLRDTEIFVAFSLYHLSWVIERA
jgi:hypothetical protein